MLARAVLAPGVGSRPRSNFSPATPHVAPRTPPVVRRVPRATSAGASQQQHTSFTIHGRHVDVTPEVDQWVRTRLADTLDKYNWGDYLEAEGQLSEVDVRLMNSQAEITLTARHPNKAVADTFLRQGELKVMGTGADMASSLEAAAAELEKKLTKWSKAPPRKKDYRSLNRN